MCSPRIRTTTDCAVGAPLWKGAFLSLDGGQQKIRGSVNGNILVPDLSERTPLTTDPATRAIVERFMSAFPLVAPNRTDIDPRALNTNAPQIIDTNNASGRIDQLLGPRDRLTLRYAFVSQQVNAFELLKGQNPDTTTKSHASQLTWERASECSFERQACRLDSTVCIRCWYPSRTRSGRRFLSAA